VNAASAAVLLAGLAGLLSADERSVAAARLHRLGQGAACARPADGSAAGHRSRLLAGAELSSWVARTVAAVAAALLVTGRPGPALVLVVLALWLGVPPARRRRKAAAARAVVDRDLPRAADLTATCLEAGAAPVDALLAVADAIGGPVAARLRAVSLAVRIGTDPSELPQIAVADEDPNAAQLSAVARATVTGAPLADSVRAVAADQRERARWQALERARRAGVQAVGPLAVCFLPAFVLVGVVPVVVGVARTLLVGWS
jgi:pilus assembly protein TadC